MSFTIAESVDEALAALAAGASPIAGGTDLVVGTRQGKAHLPPSLVAIDRLDELNHIESGEHGIRIGATVTHSRLMIEPTIVSGYTALADAAALVGSPSTRNIGTLGWQHHERLSRHGYRRALDGPGRGSATPFHGGIAGRGIVRSMDRTRSDECYGRRTVCGH